MYKSPSSLAWSTLLAAQLTWGKCHHPSPIFSLHHSTACVIFCKQKSDHVSPLLKTPRSLGVKAQILTQPVSNLLPTSTSLPSQPPALPLLTGSGSTSVLRVLEHARHPLAQVSSPCFPFTQKPDGMAHALISFRPLLKCCCFKAAFPDHSPENNLPLLPLPCSWSPLST